MSDNNTKKYDAESCAIMWKEDVFKKIKNRASYKIFRAMPLVLIIFIILFIVLAFAKVWNPEESNPSVNFMCDKTMDLCIGMISSILLLWLGSGRIEYLSHKMAFPKITCKKSYYADVKDWIKKARPSSDTNKVYIDDNKSPSDNVINVKPAAVTLPKITLPLNGI